MDSRPRPHKRARVQGVFYRSRDLRIEGTGTGTREDRVKRPGRPGQGRDLGLGLLATNLFV
jgi:hypothetical protein